ncbi:hypothetical protein H4R19_005252 [Coemansia spiralis]|nr:hypothetical protein H4R19_005252 [Coemansia spiralis]
MVRSALMFSPLLSLPRWIVPAPLCPAPEAPNHSTFPGFLTAQMPDDMGPMASEETLRAQAQTAHELLASIRLRHVRLTSLLNTLGTYRANPLGGAMCTEIAHRIHQLCLLIRAQQNQLKNIIHDYEHGPVDCTVPAAPAAAADGAACNAQPAPVVNWMEAARHALLAEVTQFCTDLPHIEKSSLLARFPPATGQIQHTYAWPVAPRPMAST